MERGNLLLQLLYRLLLLSQEAAPSAEQQQQTAVLVKPPAMLMTGSDDALEAVASGVPFSGLQGSQLQAVKESFPSLQDVLPEQLILMVLQSLFFVLDKPANKRVLKIEKQRRSYLVVPLEGGFCSQQLGLAVQRGKQLHWHHPSSIHVRVSFLTY